jgi:hypothetical protein
MSNPQSGGREKLGRFSHDLCHATSPCRNPADPKAWHDREDRGTDSDSVVSIMLDFPSPLAGPSPQSSSRVRSARFWVGGPKGLGNGVIGGNLSQTLQSLTSVNARSVGNS